MASTADQVPGFDTTNDPIQPGQNPNPTPIEPSQLVAVTEAEQYTVLTRMTFRALGASAKAITIDHPREHVANLSGTATHVDWFPSDPKNPDGEMLPGLIGTFIGVNLGAGREYRSGTMFMHKAMQQLLQQPLEDARRAGQQTSITFAWQLHKVLSSNPAGYTWEVRPIVRELKADPGQLLAALIGAPSAGGMKPQLARRSAQQPGAGTVIDVDPDQDPEPGLGGHPHDDNDADLAKYAADARSARKGA